MIAGTYYSTGLGACGVTNSDTDYIAAVSATLFDNYPGYDGSNSNENPICNKKVTAKCKLPHATPPRNLHADPHVPADGSKTVTVTITDRCTGCSTWDLDFSPSAFTQLADESVGRISGVKWSFK